MTTLGIEFQEGRGAARDPANYISVPEDGELHEATKNIWPWAPCNFENNRMILPSVYLEEPFGMSPVQEPSGLRTLKFTERCLGVDEFLGNAWEFLKDSGVFIAQDEDGNDVPKIYESLYELLSWSNEAILRYPEEPSLQVSADSFDWLEGFDNNAGTRDADISWFADGLNLQTMTSSGPMRRWTIMAHESAEAEENQVRSNREATHPPIPAALKGQTKAQGT